MAIVVIFFKDCISHLFRLALLCGILLTTSAIAHDGHDHSLGEDDEASVDGPIVITEVARQNLGLKTVEAEVRTIETVLSAIGYVVPIRNRSAAITSRVAGRIYSLKIQEGEPVRKGQTLVEVESRQLGDPPPRVEYQSPIDGVVLDRHAVLGDNVEPNKHLLKVVDLTDVYIEGRIFEGQISLVKIGQRVRVSVESYPKEEFEGKVEVVSSSLDPKSRTLKVWVKVSNRDLKLRPNMRATLHMITGHSDSVIAVPHQSILGDAGDFFVFVQSDSNPLEFKKQRVVLGERDERFTEIVDGVLPGDKVVTVGNYQLQYVKAQPKGESEQEDKKREEGGFHSEEIKDTRQNFKFYGVFLWLSLGLNILLLFKLSMKRDRGAN
jgi:multidrug efflux pump subunit AcrA (membrane-fusion protein)